MADQYFHLVQDPNLKLNHLFLHLCFPKQTPSKLRKNINKVIMLRKENIPYKKIDVTKNTINDIGNIVVCTLSRYVC